MPPIDPEERLAMFKKQSRQQPSVKVVKKVKERRSPIVTGGCGELMGVA